MAEQKTTYVEQQGKLFQRRFAEWQALRAEMLRFNLEPVPNGSDTDYETRHDVLERQIEDAARLAMTTHAPRDWMVWNKFVILEDALFGDGDSGGFTDHRPLWMLAGIKADLMALGIGTTEG